MTTNQSQPAARGAKRFRRSRLVRWLRNLAVGLLVLLAGGTAYESLAAARDARLYPPPGELIDAGGYRLHIHCIGSGSPTVILESGSGTPSPVWDLVQPEIAQFTRVCAYDRAGYGWSDPAPAARTGDQVVTDLHTLLDRAGIKGPLVLVAHSLGGMYARLYAHRYPDQVAGLVLVDARHEDFGPAAAQAGIEMPEPGQGGGVLAFLIRTGLVRTALALGGPEVAGLGVINRLGPESQRVFQALLLRPQQVAAQSAEGRELPGLETALREAGLQDEPPLGNRPLVVITQGKGLGFPDPAADTLWRQSQERQARLSTRGRLVVAAASGHYIQLEQPERVVQATRDVLAVLRP